MTSWKFTICMSRGRVFGKTSHLRGWTKRKTPWYLLPKPNRLSLLPLHLINYWSENYRLQILIWQFLVSNQVVSDVIVSILLDILIRYSSLQSLISLLYTHWCSWDWSSLLFRFFFRWYLNVVLWLLLLLDFIVFCVLTHHNSHSRWSDFELFTLLFLCWCLLFLFFIYFLQSLAFSYELLFCPLQYKLPLIY